MHAVQSTDMVPDFLLLHTQRWLGLLWFNASATARVISRRRNDDDDDISFLVEEAYTAKIF